MTATEVTGNAKALIDEVDNVSKQQLSASGRIKIRKLGWIIRAATLSIVAVIMWHIITFSIETNDMIMMASLILPIHTLVITLIAWIWYTNPAHKVPEIKGNPKVSIIIPIYNQAKLIESVIDGIFASTYKNIEVIAVNDGSKDATMETLIDLSRKYKRLIVINKRNQGKRKAVGTGFLKCTGEYVVLVDSDSIIDPRAIEEFVKAFESNPKIGAAVGHVKVLNANKNLLTRCQDTWYDFAFNIQKCCESSFGSVTCCSGCLAGYRRAHIEKFVPYWMRSTVDCSDDRELTSYIIAPAEAKRALIDYMPKSKFAEKLLRDASQYDDAEDRILTANALVRSDAVYVASAIVYTDVPETFRKFTRQQERWKKGYLRTNFYVSTFFWKRNPLMAMLYYTEYAASFITPFIALGVTVFQPLVLGHYWMPLMFAALLVLKGFLLGIDYRLRDPNSKNWKYNVLMSMLSQFVVSWMLIPALLHIRNNRWGTR